jgi:lipopolysaccharide export system ATP-binding protein
MSAHPIGISSWIAAAGPEDRTALSALRETVRTADEAGSVDRARLSADLAPSMVRLRDAGLVELLDTAEPSGLDGANWNRARLTPPALADLMEHEIEAGRESLLDEIDQRIRTLESRDQTEPEGIAPVAAPLVEDQARFSAEGSAEADLPGPATDPGAVEVDRAESDSETNGTGVANGGGAAPPRPGSTLASRGLVKVYRKRRVVNEVDLYLRQGEIVGLLGPNGAGKTTTFYMVVGLIKPDRGKVYLGDDEVTSVPMYRRARRGIGYLAQEPSVFRKLTVEENVLAVLQMMGLSRKEQRARLEVLLDELGIKHLRHTKAYALSGGERRRLEITRALVGNPKFMLLDEPFAGVDPIAVHDIQQIVSDLRRREIGVLISDHNVEQTLDIVDRAYIMYDGRVRVSGTVSELVWNDEVAEIYLGPTLTARMRQRYAPPTEEAG